MIPLYTTSQVREADNYAIEELKIPSIVLMENASINIFNQIKYNFPDLSPITPIGVLCGKGNNGGDGFAVARHFMNSGFTVYIILVGKTEELKGDAEVNFIITRTLISQIGNSKIIEYKSKSDLRKFKDCSLIVDALLGTGTKGELKEPYKYIINEINSFNCNKVAVDNPSGLNLDVGSGDTVFNADLTVTLAENKRGLYINEGYKNSGKVIKGSIGIGEEYFNTLEVEDYLIEPEDAFFSLPKRKVDAHKYSSGKALVVAGSGIMPGAACFTSNAVTKIGGGSLFLGFPNSSKATVQEKLEVGIVSPYASEGEFLAVKNISDLKSRIEWAEVIAVGPGLGRESETQNAVKEILKKYPKKKFVIDADAIYAIRNGEYRKFNLKNSIITPHYGEFAELLGIKTEDVKNDVLTHGKKFAKDSGAYLVLKGAPTIIFTPLGEALINTVGNAGMAKFGTGDVLTGLIAGLLAQQGNREEAAISGVYIHSLAADLLKNDFTELAYTAQDILNHIPYTVKFLENSFV